MSIYLAITEIHLWWMKFVGPLTSFIVGFDCKWISMIAQIEIKRK